MCLSLTHTHTHSCSKLNTVSKIKEKKAAACESKLVPQVFHADTFLNLTQLLSNISMSALTKTSASHLTQRKVSVLTAKMIAAMRSARLRACFSWLWAASADKKRRNCSDGVWAFPKWVLLRYTHTHAHTGPVLLVNNFEKSARTLPSRKTTRL